jgi:hypothetical protein
MQFGIFDHVDRNDRSLAQQLDERIRYIALAEELGFYCYHVAEHHASPINMVPVPGLFLAAAARATKKIKLGPGPALRFGSDAGLPEIALARNEKRREVPGSRAASPPNA